MPSKLRLYAAVASATLVGEGKTFFDLYTESASEGVRTYLERQFPFLHNYTVLRPSLHWPYEVGPDRVKVPKLIVVLVLSVDDAELDAVEAAVRDSREQADQLCADPSIFLSDHWCPVQPGQTQFGKRADARRLIGADALGRPPFSGKDVNVVIVDQGLNRAWIEAHFGLGRFGGGWPFNPSSGDPRPGRLPGDTSVGDAQHGLMLARNVLNIAPEARLYDLPIIPPRIYNLQLFLDEAHAAYNSMLTDIYQRGGTWVLVNAWAVFDRLSEVPLGDYTENLFAPSPGLHPFTHDVADALDHRIDVIFCAGNCGQFCPDERCGGTDRGPGHSIWGANSYHRVLTIGAVRTDRTWIGYSSQGPGQPRLALPGPNVTNRKPDLCLPSGFGEDFDAHTLNRGTSAASGMAAGVVAALRSRWDSNTVSPARLQAVLNQTAQNPVSGGWDPRFGNGILNIGLALPQFP